MSPRQVVSVTDNAFGDNVQSGTNSFKLTNMYNDSRGNITPRRLQPIPQLVSSKLDSELNESDFNSRINQQRKRTEAAK